jgi:hypothetical protein
VSEDNRESQDVTSLDRDPFAWNLIKKYRSVQEAEAENMVTDPRLGDMPVPFGFTNDALRQLLGEMQDGDELWTFSSSDESWKHLAGHAGISLVRDGKVISSLVTQMN